MNELSERERQVAIVGRCEKTRADAPLDDPAWACWGLAWDLTFVGERYFEIHVPHTWRADTISPSVDYRTWLRHLDGDKVMAEAYADIPGSRAYPLENVLALPGMRPNGLEDGYLESSIAYMLAMARVENVKRVGIWGVDLSHPDEYCYQKPNLAYLMGLFRYQGMDIRVPRESGLWNLSLLDDLPTPDFMDGAADRADLEYLLGREIAKGCMPSDIRPDLLTSCWAQPARYGSHILREAA